MFSHYSVQLVQNSQAQIPSLFVLFTHGFVRPCARRLMEGLARHNAVCLGRFTNPALTLRSGIVGPERALSKVADRSAVSENALEVVFMHDLVGTVLVANDLVMGAQFVASRMAPTRAAFSFRRLPACARPCLCHLARLTEGPLRLRSGRLTALIRLFVFVRFVRGRIFVVSHQFDGSDTSPDEEHLDEGDREPMRNDARTDQEIGDGFDDPVTSSRSARALEKITPALFWYSLANSLTLGTRALFLRELLQNQ